MCVRVCAHKRGTRGEREESAIEGPERQRSRPSPPTRRPLSLQTGAAGKPVNTLYVAGKMDLRREMYFAILLDRATAGPVMIGCRWGRGRGGDVSVWGGW